MIDFVGIKTVCKRVVGDLIGGVRVPKEGGRYRGWGVERAHLGNSGSSTKWGRFFGRDVRSRRL